MNCSLCRYSVYFLLLLITTQCTSASFASRTEDYIHRLGDGVHNSFNDPYYLLAAGGIAGAAYFDHTVKNSFQGRLMPGPVSHVADMYGNGWNWIVGNAFIAAEYWSSNRPKEEFKDYLQVYNEAFIVNGVFTFAVKSLVKRERPGKQNKYSFPSGHTSSSFVVASVLYELYGADVGVPAYTMATVTGLQRIHSNWHWFSDVVAGAVLGTLIGKGFSELVECKAPESSQPLMVHFSFAF